MFSGSVRVIALRHNDRLPFLLGATSFRNGTETSRIGDSSVHPPCGPVIVRGRIGGGLVLQLLRAEAALLDGDGLTWLRL